MQKSELSNADQLRQKNPDAAHGIYLALHPSEVAQDPARLSWIFDQLRGRSKEDYVPLLEYAAEHTQGLSCRGAKHQLATWHWYHARAEQAETLWTAALRLGRDAQDELWVGCALNLGLVFDAQGRSLECLALTGAAIRIAKELGDSFSVAFGSIRRAAILVQLDELELADGALTTSEQLLDRIESPRRKFLIENSLATGRAKLLRAKGDFQAALAVQLKSITLAEAVPPSLISVLVGAHCGRIHLEYELASDPSELDALMQELEGIPNRFDLEESWHDAWRDEILPLRVRHSLGRLHDPAAALKHGRDLLRFLASSLGDDSIVTRASDLGRQFAEELGSPEDSKRAYELAASAALRRIVIVDLTLSQLPETAEIADADIALIKSYRERLQIKHGALFDAIADLWRAGHQASGLVLDGGDLVMACAWCHRIRTATGRWLPIAQFMPSSADFTVSHGICPACEREMMETLGTRPTESTPNIE